jgi:Mn2+/Fe2+ NRAMP family transporter
MRDRSASATAMVAASRPHFGRAFLAASGPGLVVMLAGTDAGSIITAAQSGAEFGYGLLLFQLAVIPVLYVAQELALRLALGSGRGMGELIRARFGKAASGILTGVLTISCFGSLVTQFGGLAAVGQLVDIPVWLTIAAAVSGVAFMVVTGSYHSVERIVILFGGFELAFVYAGWKSAPHIDRLAAQIGDMPFHDQRYLYLLAANLGTTLMPWAIFYQTSAAVDKGLTLPSLRYARLDTFLGAVVCQIVTAGVLVTTAANTGSASGAAGDVPAFAQMFSQALRSPLGAVLFAAGLMGGALVATVVVCLAATWAISEASGLRHSLEHRPRGAPWFYATFIALLLAGGLFVALGVDVVKLSIAVGVINALLLPVVLVFLFLLACSELEPSLRPSGATGFATALLLGGVCILGLYSGLVGVFG